MGEEESILAGQTNQDELYAEALDQFGPALERLVRAYESDSDKRRDLSQDVHLQLWRSLQNYNSRCSLRTWVYRVAHHVAVSHIIRARRTLSNLVSLEEIEVLPDKTDAQSAADRRVDLNRLSTLIQRLKPLDRQVIVCYLEDMDAASTGEVTGLSPANVAMRVHRIKNILAKRFQQRQDEGGNDAE